MTGRRPVTFVRPTLAVAAACVVLLAAGPSMAAGDVEAPKSPGFSFQGPFGTYDRGELQRGFQVYQEVCSACHSLKYFAFRNLRSIGFDEVQAKAIAAQYEVMGGPDEEGEMFERPAVLADFMPAPFANDNAARAANNGALPPDPPADVELGEGMDYNPYFGGSQIAMPPPLLEDGVEYADGTKASVDQMARDVTTFLTWAAEPDMEARKRMGIKVMVFLVLMTVLLYMVKRKVWSDVH